MALRSGRVGIHPSQVDPITGMLINVPTPDSVSLEDLSDVQITDPEDGAYLVYDVENNKWINSVTPPAPVVPEGSTVTPTDDIQTWLACASITDKTYTTLAEVLNDSTTLLALMSNNNAVDYLVRSTTWASGITADSTAMTDIGANNYCANTLLDDATWCTAICNSTYFESVLNVKVPTMTSNTTPSGVAFASAHTDNDGGEPYKAFDGSNADTLDAWATLSGYVSGEYVGYQFPSAVAIKKVVITNRKRSPSYGIKNFKIQGSDDGITYTDILTDIMSSDAIEYSQSFVLASNSTTRQYHRVYCVDGYSNSYLRIGELQFYGRQDI